MRHEFVGYASLGILVVAFVLSLVAANYEPANSTETCEGFNPLCGLTLDFTGLILSMLSVVLLIAGLAAFVLYLVLRTRAASRRERRLTKRNS